MATHNFILKQVKATKQSKSSVSKNTGAKKTSNEEKSKKVTRKEKFLKLINKVVDDKISKEQQSESTDNILKLSLLKESLKSVNVKNVLNNKNPKHFGAKKQQRVIESEKKLFQEIMSVPEFQEDPFATMKKHLENTLAQTKPIVMKKQKTSNKKK